MNPEKQRLEENRLGKQPWRKWGPYLSERQWGTVREDYSPGGDAWFFFTHDHARSRAYRWGEDGIAGISDDEQRLCLSLALWNGRDPILKERLFGLTNSEGNHGEDVKELYYYVDATPTHSYLKMLYKYPQREFPYQRLVEENRQRSKDQPEFELLDTGLFDDDRYFDVFVEYAKASVDDLLILVTIHNRGPEEAEIHVLPQLWFRNAWSWKGNAVKPKLTLTDEGAIAAVHPELGGFVLHADGAPKVIFCDNETNSQRLFGTNGAKGHYKDAFHDYVVHGQYGSVNPEQTGTKAAAHYHLHVPAQGVVQLRLRLTKETDANPFFAFDGIFRQRQHEADAFYADLQADLVDADARLTGQFLCSREAIREFKRRGVRKNVSCAAGKIICISSVHEVIPWAGHVNYAASKGGVMLMMKSIAQEVAPYRIRVNSICPGAIRTPINREAWETPEAYSDLMKLIPYKRIGEVEDIGRTAVWLASDEADYIHGASIFVDGGMTLYPGFEAGG